MIAVSKQNFKMDSLWLQQEQYIISYTFRLSNMTGEKISLS